MAFLNCVVGDGVDQVAKGDAGLHSAAAEELIIDMRAVQRGMGGVLRSWELL